MIGKNRQSITDEPVEVQVGKNRLRNNRLDLPTLRSQLVIYARKSPRSLLETLGF